ICDRASSIESAAISTVAVDTPSRISSSYVFIFSSFWFGVGAVHQPCLYLAIGSARLQAILEEKIKNFQSLGGVFRYAGRMSKINQSEKSALMSSLSSSSLGSYPQTCIIGRSIPSTVSTQ